MLPTDGLAVKAAQHEGKTEVWNFLLKYYKTCKIVIKLLLHDVHKYCRVVICCK